MSPHEHSDSTIHSASTVLPSPDVSVPLPSAEVVRSPTRNRRPNAQRKISFTRANVTKMRCPPGLGEAFFWDAGCRGFGMRVLISVRRSWLYQYRDEHKRTRRIALGDVSAVDLDAARTSARQHAATVTKGGNPSVQRRSRRRAASVIDLVDPYLEQVKAEQRPRSYKETERHLRRHAAPLHHDRVEAVQRRDIAALLERVKKHSGPIAANRVRAALSAMWTWGLRTGRIESDSNPVSFTVRQPEKSRERTLADAEIRAIWNATAGHDDYSRIVRLCLLTGCRREEVGRLRWDEVGEDRLSIGASRMKGGISHEIPILPMISSALPVKPSDAAVVNVFGRSGTGYSGWSKSKKALDIRIAQAGSGLAPWGLHDLRRTLSTRLHDAGVEPIVIEALLAHKQQGVAAVYNRASFREAKKAAVKQWHSVICNIVSDGCEP
jgi:integrase